MDEEDLMAQLRAEADQARAALVDLASTLAAFYSELEDRGLEPELAVALTLGLMHEMLAHRGGNDE